MLSRGTESTLLFFLPFSPGKERICFAGHIHPKTLVKKDSFEKQLHSARVSLIIKSCNSVFGGDIQ